MSAITQKSATGKKRLVKVVLGPEWNGAIMTPEEFDAVMEYDELYHYELLHGVVIVKEFAEAPEAAANEMLGHLLRSHAQFDPDSETRDVTLPMHYVATPNSRWLVDRVVWLGLGRLPHPLRDVPTIVAEFVCANRQHWLRDYETKKAEFLAAGTKEYWLIDRFRRQMTVHRLDGKEMAIKSRQVYRTRLLPGFELPLNRILAEANQWITPAQKNSKKPTRS